ncbi:hypothetical protein [Saccharopolyspora hattusasensis]|uniref:hypothetical protein n=1 Tax=Saccharopolyspora hattusasensis TaxID=1128679 RepID=UPI003D96D6BD
MTLTIPSMAEVTDTPAPRPPDKLAASRYDVASGVDHERYLPYGAFKFERRNGE